MKILSDVRYLSRDPFKDWLIILVVTCLISISFIFSAFGTYNSIDQRVSNVTTNSSDEKLSFDSTAFNQAVKILDDREINRQAVVNQAVGVGDPTI